MSASAIGSRTSITGSVLMALWLTGCAAPSYDVGFDTYRNREDAMAAIGRHNASAEGGIVAGQSPLVDRSLLVVSPTAEAISRAYEAMVTKAGKQYAAPGTPARRQDDFDAEAQAANLRSVVASVRRANIYRDVELLSAQSMATDVQPSPGQDVLAFVVGGASTSIVSYFTGVRGGRQVVAIDMGRASPGERRKSFIDDLKAKALQ